MDELDAVLELDSLPKIPDEEDDFRSLKIAISICLSLIIITAGSTLLIAINNWLNDELIGPNTELTSRQTEYNKLVGFDETMNLGLTGNGVNVCIVDSGIDITHPDLANIKLLKWRDFVNQNPQPYDDHGHGTSMAGLLGAEGGLTGNAKGVNLLIAKALSKEGQGEDEWVSSAIEWCSTNGADIISLSLGGAPGIIPSFLTGGNSGDAASSAINQGIYVVAAAGNDGGEDSDEDVDNPGSEELVICVGGVQADGQIWSGSSKGDNGINIFPPRLARDDPNKKPEIVAPAERVPVLSIIDSGYAFASGTSAATVYVTAAISVLLEDQPELKRNGAEGGSASSVENMKQWIMNTVSSPYVSHHEYYGYGLLKVLELIQHNSSSSNHQSSFEVNHCESCNQKVAIHAPYSKILLAHDRD